MTNRELAWGAAGLVVGVIAVLTTAFVLTRHRQPAVTAASADAGAEDATPVAPLEPEPSPDEPEPATPDARVAQADVGPPPPQDASAHARDSGLRHEAAGGVVHASNLLIHPGGNEQLCIDESTHAGLTLFPCHGRKNQRFTFAEDPGGVIRISGAKGGCLRLGDMLGSDRRLELGPCGGDASGFRHRDDRRFREVATGLCMTVTRVGKRAPIVLETCDAANAGQVWSLAK